MFSVSSLFILLLSQELRKYFRQLLEPFVMPPRKRPRTKRAPKKAEQEQDGSETPKRVRQSRPRGMGKRAMIQAQKKAVQYQGVDYQSSMADAYLSAQILHQIFLQLPTKPLVQLKCLSKLWKRQISDPNFMNLRSRPMIFLPSFPFLAIDNTGTPLMIKLSNPVINPERYREITVAGSFKGILVLVLKYGIPVDNILLEDDIVLYNPFSGEFKELPHSRKFDPCTKYVYGFGYGTTADDLKIVRLKDNSSGRVKSCEVDYKSCEVFSLKYMSWSRPSKFIGDYFVSNSYSGIFANGFLYWNAMRTAHFRTPLILALDLKKMVFSEIEIPDRRSLIRLGTYKGRLCMLCSQVNVEGYELRVMNEHGFGKSWSTVLSFKSSLSMLISYASCVGRMCILDDGKLLMWQPSEQQFVIYDMFKDSHMVVKLLTDFDQKGRLHSLEYVESSVSPSDICSVSI
ncbi:putative F-box associated interaction domain, F-box-like domain superfamily [Helianthus annuus]|nr:putative F-box associated interaction domain, F-box-like domain superfamily [Helianthus annuus]